MLFTFFKTNVFEHSAGSSPGCWIQRQCEKLLTWYDVSWMFDIFGCLGYKVVLVKICWTLA